VAGNSTAQAQSLSKLIITNPYLSEVEPLGTTRKVELHCRPGAMRDLHNPIMLCRLEAQASIIQER
jgi:hypothetical protein